MSQQLIKMDDYVKKPKVIKEEKWKWESPNLQFNLDDYQGGKTSLAEQKKKHNGNEVNWDYEINKMTPRSQVNAFKYKEQVLSPKGIFVEEFFDENPIILEYKASYTVPKFMMVTMKLLGNIIICDDKNSVSILNAETMQRIAQIPNPNENSYLYAVFKHDGSKTILMSYDNKMLIGYDSQTYNKKLSVSMNCTCQKFTELHSDPQNYLIMGCENGIIKILQPSRNQVIYEFDMDQALRKEEGVEQSMNQSMETKVGDIIEINQTIDVHKSHQYMVLTKEGLFIVTINQNKGSGKGFTFSLEASEQYFQGKTVKGAFEYKQGKIIAVINSSQQIRFIDRQSYSEESHLKIQNISNDSNYCSLLPFPNYSYESFPYVLVKDSKGLNVINVRTLQLRVILKDCPYSWDVIRTYMMDFSESLDNDGTVTLFNLELRSRNISETSRAKEHTSTIKKFTIIPENLDCCFK